MVLYCKKEDVDKDTIRVCTQVYAPLLFKDIKVTKVLRKHRDVTEDN